MYMEANHIVISKNLYQIRIRDFSVDISSLITRPQRLKAIEIFSERCKQRDQQKGSGRPLAA